jgi:hypothetical protein
VDDPSIKAGRQFLIVNSRHLPSEDSPHKYFLTDDPEKGTHISRQALLNECIKRNEIEKQNYAAKKDHQF